MLALLQRRGLVLLAAALMYTRPGFGAPALTTIQDTLYKADGTRFEGTIYITWTNFQTANNTTIPTQGITVQVVNGTLKIQLTPTTNASAGANYAVRYSSQGQFQFSETWAVPPSTQPLRVRDVRIGTGSVIGPGPVSSTILIGDVTGLVNELNLRPLRGAGFAPARAAVINSSGQFDAAVGSPSDCVRVDGSSGPCGEAGSGTAGSFTAFAAGETPAGLVDGVNSSFTLRFNPGDSLALYRNGIVLKQGLDYNLSAKTIVFVSNAVPQPADVIIAYYRYGDPSNPLASFTPTQVICSSVGMATSSTVATSLGTCTIPAGVLAPGDRVEMRYEYAHTGNASGFTTQISWQNTVILSRSASASEILLAGRGSSALDSAGAQWSTESWGASMTYAVEAGVATDDTSVALTINFRASMSGSSSDSIKLRNFTVLRYPAQANP